MTARPPEVHELPLSGIRVLDLSRVLAGPFATMQLADLGAEVFKVERPGTGDETRAWGPPFLEGVDGADTRESAYFLAVNRGKKSLAVDLKSADGVRLVRELALRCDIVVENFVPGALARLGLDLAELREAHPPLVTCSITGFGEDAGARPGYDAVVQATGGLMSITGEPDGPPLKVGVAIADVLAGHSALSGMLAALFAARVRGRGRHVSVALEDALVAALVNQTQNALVTGRAPGRLGSAHPNIVPYQTCAALDGHFVLAVGNDAQFARLVNALERPELATDPRFVENAGRVEHRAALLAILGPLFRTRTSAAWLELCERASVPAGKIRDLCEVLDDPALRARGMRVSLEHPTLGTFDVAGSPFGPASSIPPPRLGEHTREVLASVLGLGAEELVALEERGVLA